MDTTTYPLHVMTTKQTLKLIHIILPQRGGIFIKENKFLKCITHWKKNAHCIIFSLTKIVPLSFPHKIFYEVVKTHQTHFIGY